MPGNAQPINYCIKCSRISGYVSELADAVFFGST